VKQPDYVCQDTPPNALARDRCWWQISWLAGRRLEAAFPRVSVTLSGKIARRLSAYSCGGSRGIVRVKRCTHRVPF